MDEDKDLSLTVFQGRRLFHLGGVVLIPEDIVDEFDGGGVPFPQWPGRMFLTAEGVTELADQDESEAVVLTRLDHVELTKRVRAVH